MENVVSHQGVVDAIEGNSLRVRIAQAPACAGCAVASHCHTAEAQEKVVTVPAGGADRWHVGDSVVVCASRRTAGKALLLGFGLPLVVMLAVLAVASMLGAGEGLTALLGLCALVPYYIILWFLRHRIAGGVAFWIEEQTLK